MGEITHLLFDVDGVLLDSEACHRRVWDTWAKMRGLDPAAVCASTGQRSIDMIIQVAPYLDPKAESAALDDIMRMEIDCIQPFPGARQLLEELRPGIWAIVTSGNQWSVEHCFRSHGLPLPAVQVYGESVQLAKPAPDAYRLAVSQLCAEPERCMVIEDSPVGVAAAKSANCNVIAISTTVPCRQLREAARCFPSLREATAFLHSLVRELCLKD